MSYENLLLTSCI